MRTIATLLSLLISPAAWSQPEAAPKPPSQAPVRADVEATIIDSTVVPGDPDRDEGPMRWPGSVQSLDDIPGTPMPVPTLNGSDPKRPSRPSDAIAWDGTVYPASSMEISAGGGEGSHGDLTTLIHDPEDSFSTTDFSSLYQTCAECFPARMNVRLSLAFPNGKTYTCSGALIDSRHVLTAGHCIYRPGDGGWVSRVTVQPAFDNGVSSYGTAEKRNLMTWTGWYYDQNFDHDMGVVQLDRPVGALTGWYGYSTASSSYLESPTWWSFSYPGESYGSMTMYYQSGYFDTTPSTYQARARRKAIQGQSGSGAYKFFGSQRRIAAVQSHNRWNWWYGWDANSARVTSNKYGHLVNYISNATPDTPDLIPLDVRADSSAWRGSWKYVTYLVHNYSDRSRYGSFTVRTYLSTNPNISYLDTLLNTHTVDYDLRPKQSVRVGTWVYIPGSTGGGTRYLGVIVQDSDYDNFNNDTDGQDAHEIVIL